MEEVWKVTYTGAKLVGKFLEGLSQNELACSSEFRWLTPRRKKD
jgi:hypothetical protein